MTFFVKIYYKFGHERDEVTGKWRRLNNEELYDQHSLPAPNVIRLMISIMRRAEHVARVGDRRGAYRVLVGRKRRPGRPRRRWEDNTKTHLQEVRWGGMRWVVLAQSRGR
jgi:hypothetical protein